MKQRQEATAEQAKAIANPLRLQILRLCNDREWTNKELADRLDRDPSTVLYHLRLLVKARLIEPTDVRQGASGAYEKPYRSTGLSWHLDLKKPIEVVDTEPPILTAFRRELGEAGNDSLTELNRFHLHLNELDAKRFAHRFVDLINEFIANDDGRRLAGAPGHGGIMVIHRLSAEQEDRA